MVYVKTSRGEKSEQEEKLTLDLVQVIFRHGQRTPSRQEARFLNVTEASSVYETDFGLLTKEGMMQEFKLGQMLRNHYNEYLGKYKESSVEAKTTYYSRTKMSLQLVLAGLFPPTPDEQWHPDLQWRPIPYDVTQNSFDVVLNSHENPKLLKMWLSTVLKSEEYNSLLSEHKEFLKSVEKWLGHALLDNSMAHICYVTISLKIHRLLNIPLPNWCTEEVYQTLEKLYSFILNSMALTEELKKFSSGPLIKLIIDNIDSSKRDKAKKIHLYSTHDLSLIGFAASQDIVNSFKLPPFGSCYIVENYKDSEQQNYIRILSWDGSSDHFVELEIKNCERFCPLEKYKSTVESIIPTDEDIEFITFDSFATSYKVTL